MPRDYERSRKELDAIIAISSAIRAKPRIDVAM
jgi:hypothetical protein